MQVYAITNNFLNTDHLFNAEAYTLILELGGKAFYNASGSTNISYRAGSGKRATWLRMDLVENEAGFNRLKIHYLATGKVRMEFYPFISFGNGKGIDGPKTVEEVSFSELGPTFERVSRVVMRSRASSAGEKADTTEDEDYYF